MADSAESKPAREEKKELSREERLERIRRLIANQGQEAAKVLKMWLQRHEETRSRRRK